MPPARRRRRLAALIAVVVAAAGCTGTDRGSAAGDLRRAAPAGSRGATEVTVTDIAGRTVTVPAPVERVILSESRLLYILAPLAPDDPFRRVAGWADDLRVNDVETWEEYRARFPHVSDIPVLGSIGEGTFSLEAAIDLAPDVVVLSYDSYTTAVESGLVGRLDAAGIPSVVVDFRRHPLENTLPSVALLGRLLGREAEAGRFTRFYAEHVDAVETRLERAGASRPSTFVYRAAGYSPECCATFGRGSLGEFVERAGGDNLGSRLLPGWSGTLHPEEVLTSDPDVIIVTGSNWSNSRPGGGWVGLGYATPAPAAQAQLAGLVARTPGWDGLTAVRQGRVHGIWHQFYVSPYHFATLTQFAKWLHPGLFSDVDPEALFRRFHDEFLPIPFGGTFWTTLPAPPAG